MFFLNQGKDSTFILTAYDSPINLNSRERFEVIVDQRGVLPPLEITAGVIAETTSLGVLPQPIEIYRKLKNRETQFRGDMNAATGNQEGDIATGALWMYTWGNLADVTAPWHLEGNCRLRYIDV